MRSPESRPIRSRASSPESMFSFRTDDVASRSSKGREVVRPAVPLLLETDKVGVTPALEADEAFPPFKLPRSPRSNGDLPSTQAPVPQPEVIGTTSPMAPKVVTGAVPHAASDAK